MKIEYYPAQKAPLGYTELNTKGVISSTLINGDGTVSVFLESGKELFYLFDQCVYCFKD